MCVVDSGVDDGNCHARPGGLGVGFLGVYRWQHPLVRLKVTVHDCVDIRRNELSSAPDEAGNSGTATAAAVRATRTRRTDMGHSVKRRARTQCPRWRVDGSARCVKLDLPRRGKAKLLCSP